MKNDKMMIAESLKSWETSRDFKDEIVTSPWVKSYCRRSAVPVSELSQHFAAPGLLALRGNGQSQRQ